jgi:hypothetical protein
VKATKSVTAVFAGFSLLGAIAWSVPTGQPAAQDPDSPDSSDRPDAAA